MYDEGILKTFSHSYSIINEVLPIDSLISSTIKYFFFSYKTNVGKVINYCGFRKKSICTRYFLLSTKTWLEICLYTTNIITTRFFFLTSNSRRRGPLIWKRDEALTKWICALTIWKVANDNEAAVTSALIDAFPLNWKKEALMKWMSAVTKQ